MKKIYVLFTCFLLSAAVLTGCQEKKESGMAVKTETKSQWGLDFEAKPAEEETEASPEGESEGAEENSLEGSAGVDIKEVENGIFLVPFENVTVKATSPVNIRKAPNKDGKKIGSLTKGKTAELTGVLTNGWAQVLYDGQEGYVNASYLKADGDVSMKDMIAKAKELAASAEGTTGSKTETTAAETTTVPETTTAPETTSAPETTTVPETTSAPETTTVPATTTAAETTAAPETTPAESKEAAESSKASEEDVDYAWTTGNVNVRTGPGASYEAIGVLTPGEKVELLDSTGNWWWKIRFNGQEAYVTMQYLTTDEPVEEQ